METENASSQLWFALRVRSNCEKRVAAAVHQKGYEEFLPLYQCRQRWSDRFKSVELPLFPGYVFCRIDARCRLPILTIPGALHFVGIGKVPAVIEDREIAAIRNVVRSGLQAAPWAYLNVGKVVHFDSGPLAGLEGILIESSKPCRVVVSVKLLKRSVAVEIEHDWIASRAAEIRSSAVNIPIRAREQSL